MAWPRLPLLPSCSCSSCLGRCGDGGLVSSGGCSPDHTLQGPLIGCRRFISVRRSLVSSLTHYGTQASSGPSCHSCHGHVPCAEGRGDIGRGEGVVRETFCLFTCSSRFGPDSVCCFEASSSQSGEGDSLVPKSIVWTEAQVASGPQDSDPGCVGLIFQPRWDPERKSILQKRVFNLGGKKGRWNVRAACPSSGFGYNQRSRKTRGGLSDASSSPDGNNIVSLCRIVSIRQGTWLVHHSPLDLLTLLLTLG